jgi:ABC-type lipoprotein export system ATPase subunit
MNRLLELRGITKDYVTPAGLVRVLRGADLDLGAGELVALTGPSGSGKTTLLNIATLLDAPTSGEVCMGGHVVRTADRELARELRKRSVGIIFQKFCLLPHRSALENVVFRCRYLDPDPRPLYRRAEQLLEELGLASVAQQPARLLSGGEMQRVSIARALMSEPSWIAADEPTGNLDREAAKVVMDHLRALTRRGLAVLLVTHNLGLLSYADRHLVCEGGAVVCRN